MYSETEWVKGSTARATGSVYQLAVPFIAFAALVISCCAITGYTTFRTDSIPRGAIEDLEDPDGDENKHDNNNENGNIIIGYEAATNLAELAFDNIFYR